MPCPKDLSRTDPAGRAYAGSQRQIQTYVNEKAEALGDAIAQSLSRYGLGKGDIEWVSPLASDAYSEYRDSEFLDRIGLGFLASDLLKFWPRMGPCWDALAQIKGGCILVEAKSHVPEIYGGGCQASLSSRLKIEKAFNETKAWLGVAADLDWTGRLYQSANRYAYLYFLREIAGVQAFLANVYFTNDPRTRTAREEWDTAIKVVNQELGIVGNVPYSGSVILPAD